MDHSHSIEQPHGTTQIGLLILIMALFIALWESDGRHHRAVAAREEQKREVQLAHRKTSVPVRDVKQVAETNSAFKNVKLPVGIVPGEYRIVSNTGVTENRWITFSDIRLQNMMPGRENRDFYLLDEPEQRIYFIRVTGQSKVARRDAIVR